MFSADTTNVNAAQTDPQFNYVTMLLHGDGTNGAQNNTFLDSSSNNFSITRYGNTTQGTFSPYGANWSNYFDGSGDYLNLSGQPISTTTWTIEAWVFITSTATYQTLYSQATGGNGNRTQVYFYTASSSADPVISIYHGSGAGASATIGAPRNQWNHIAMQCNGSTVSFYVNGVAAGSGSYSASFQATNGVIGRYTTGDDFCGYMSNFRITNTNVYSGAFTPSTVPLSAISGTKLLTCQSNRFIDNSSNAFTVTPVGETSVQRFSPFAPTAPYSTSVIGGSGYFDGSGDYLTAPDVSALQFGTGNFTVETWAYFQSLAAAPIFDQRASGPSTNAFVIYADTSGYLSFYSFSPSLSFTSNLQVKTNSWNHIAFVRSGSTGTFYLNGVASSSTVSLSLYNNTSSANRIFQAFDPAYTTGYFSDFRIVKGTAVYTSNFTPNTAPLTAISGTSLLLNATNAGILDNAMMNDLETVGNAQVSTSVKKFGTGSIALDGTGDWLFAPKTADMVIPASSTFTMECWAYFTSAQNTFKHLVSEVNGNSSRYLAINAAGIEGQFGGSSATVVAANYTFSQNTWYHIALVRNGTTVAIYINGQAQSVSNPTQTNPFFDVGTGMYIGRWGGSPSYEWPGYIDDLRITKGVARYTANFTPPTQAFPNN